MKKKIMSVFLSIAMAASLCIPATAAVSSDGSETKRFNNLKDSLDYTQAEYISNIYQGNRFLLLSRDVKDREEIERVCIGLLSIGNASSRNADYDITALAANRESLSKGFEHYKSTNDYLYAVHSALGWSVYEDNLEYSDFTVEISNNAANASIVESYTYYMGSDFDSDFCFRKRCYDITLTKTDDGLWKVVSVAIRGAEDDPPIDIVERVHAITESHRSAALKTNVPATEMEIYGKTITSNVPMRSATLYRWTYDTNAGVEHAKKYYNSSDPRFGEADQDCTNFTSQCVWVGLGGTGSKTDLPALSRDYLSTSTDPSNPNGQQFPNLWCRGWNSTFYPSEYYKRNWTWDNVRGFTNMIEESSSLTEGPFGNTHYGNLDYAAIGSVIAYTTENVADDYNLSHAMYVTDVTGTVGSRGVSNLWIAAHNSNTSSAYMPLTDYTSKREAQFATSVIGWGYYASPQP